MRVEGDSTYMQLRKEKVWKCLPSSIKKMELNEDIMN